MAKGNKKGGAAGESGSGEKSNSSTMTAVITAIVVILIVTAVVLFMRNSSGSNAGTTTSQGGSQAASATQGQTQNAQGGTQGQTTQRVKLADTRYWNYAHLISGDAPLDQGAQAAISGFHMEKQNLSDGSVQITLKAISPQYHDQQYVVKPGQKLYFIEGSFGDDAGGNEYALGDDTAVVVDADGYIVQ